MSVENEHMLYHSSKRTSTHHYHSLSVPTHTHTHHYNNFAFAYVMRREEAIDGLVIEKAIFGANLDVTAACQRLVQDSTLRCGNIVVLAPSNTCDN